MLRARSPLALVLLLGCTPLRPLDVPSDAGRVDAARVDLADAGDAASMDATAPDAPLTDSGAPRDANCGSADLCDGTDDDCDPSTLDGSGDPRRGMPCDGMDLDLCEEGVFEACVGGTLRCTDATNDSIEVCGGGDEDCDTTVDEAGAMGAEPAYVDLDRDGYGSDLVMICRGMPGFASRGGDCDDTRPMVRPGAMEACNALDDDCNGDVDDGARCGFGCQSAVHAGHTYQVCPTTVPFDDAVTRCMGYGYHLVTVDDEPENTFLVAAVRAAGSFTQDAWIGLRTSSATPGAFAWTDGTPPTYTNWTVGEPNASGDCVRLRIASTPPGTWNDTVCTNGNYYVCETP